MESCVPPGFRFHPTEEELVGYYLARKVYYQKIDLEVITDVDLYRIEPWDLQDEKGILEAVWPWALLLLLMRMVAQMGSWSFLYVEYTRDGEPQLRLVLLLFVAGGAV